MSWLRALGEQGGQRAQVIVERHTIQSALPEFQAAHVWMQSGSTDITTAPQFLQGCWNTPSQNTAHARFAQAWCLLQTHRGNQASDALKQFNSTVWPPLRKSNPKIMPDHTRCGSLFREVLHAWLVDMVNEATNFLEHTAAPVPIAAPAASTNAGAFP